MSSFPALDAGSRPSQNRSAHSVDDKDDGNSGITGVRKARNFSLPDVLRESWILGWNPHTPRSLPLGLTLFPPLAGQVGTGRSDPFSRLFSGESGISSKHQFLSPALPHRNLVDIARALRVRRVRKLMDQAFGPIF